MLPLSLEQTLRGLGLQLPYTAESSTLYRAVLYRVTRAVAAVFN
jgi:hypothetical protein